MRLYVGQEAVHCLRTPSNPKRMAEETRREIYGDRGVIVELAAGDSTLAWSLALEIDDDMEGLGYEATMAFVIRLCTGLGPGVYCIRGTELEAPSPWDTDTGVFFWSPSILYGVPLHVHVIGIAQADPIVDIPMHWLRDFMVANGLNHPFEPDRVAYSNPLRRVLYHISELLACVGRWRFRAALNAHVGTSLPGSRP